MVSMDVSVTPAILKRSFDEIQDATRRVGRVADMVQVDVVDGSYADVSTWPFSVVASGDDENHQHLFQEIQRLCMLKVSFELDLMICNPEDTLGLWLATDVSRVVIHRASTQYVTYCVSRVKDDGREVYLGLTCDDVAESIASVAGAIDGVQCMGIERIGRQGEPYVARVEDLVRSIRALYPDLPVQVDGGVSVQNLSRLVAAGVTHVAAGSAIFNGDIEKNFFALRKICVGL